MKPEEKKALGRLIRESRHGLNWTQERLAGAADVNLRTVQRAEGGYGIGSENLAPIAAALGLDEGQLRSKATTAGPPPPDKRISLKQVKSGEELIEILERCTAKGWSLEVSPRDEHRYNEMAGEEILSLAGDLDSPPKSQKEQIACIRHAQFIVSLSRKMGFGLFAGNYTEEITIKKRSQRKKATLIVAAPSTDPRIVRTTKGAELDVVRDSRRLLLGSALSEHTTMYNWLEDQVISKSDGEERVKDVFRRIMAEVMEEMNAAEADKKRQA
jgi:transcriptional regulator with XRE-family HTH domain